MAEVINFKEERYKRRPKQTDEELIHDLLSFLNEWDQLDNFRDWQMDRIPNIDDLGA